MGEPISIENYVENIQKLLTSPKLSESEAKELGKLLRLSTVKTYEPCEVIIQQGEMDPYVYFLLSGRVRVEKDGEELGLMDRPVEIFGEMRILDGLARSATVSAEKRTVCMSVNTAMATRSFSSDERANILLLLYRICTEYLAIRLRLSNDELVKTKKALKELAAPE